METFAIPTKEEKQSEVTMPALNGKNYSNVGLLILSAEFHVLFMNQEAQDMMAHLNNRCKEPLLPEDSPPGILSIIDHLMELLSHSDSSQELSTLQCRRITGPSHYQVLLRGFVFPRDARFLSRHYLVILEKISASVDKGAPRGIKFPKRYGLTERQKTIVRYVTTGLTNKQIAEALGISVYTVKEHIKHVMRKTETNTRTAAIARLTRRKPLKVHQYSSLKTLRESTESEHERATVIWQPTDQCR